MAKRLPQHVQHVANYDTFKCDNDQIIAIEAERSYGYSVTSRVPAKRSIDITDDTLLNTRSRFDSTKSSVIDIKASKITKVAVDTGELEVLPHRSDLGPSATQHPLLSLSHSSYDIPPQLVANFAAVGVHSIYPWQSSCLMRSGVLSQSKNLVYTAPTGGGKSLVADVVLLRRVIQNPRKKGLVVLPYVALVQEKVKTLRRLVEGISKETRVHEGSLRPNQFVSNAITITSFYGGGNRSKFGLSDCDVAVCTIEKANLLLNSAIEDGTIDDVGIVVCDELHMLDNEHRGYILELMLTKILTSQLEIQIIGMSATLANPEIIAGWLKAKFFIAKYRPIPIQEHLVYDNAVYPSSSSREFFRTASQLAKACATQKPDKPSHRIEISVHQELQNPVTNAVVALAVETVEQGYGALVFCSSRASVQTIARLVSRTLIHHPATADLTDKRADLVASLQTLPNGFETCLVETVTVGVGFHHAGLTTEEREIIATAYDTGVLKVIVATCSLAAGINLPARRVILNSARMGRDLVGPAMLRQMRGRAGRKGKDEIGETFLCCQKIELESVAELLEAEIPPVTSCLAAERRGLSRAVLEVICIRMLSTYESLQDYVRNSLLWHTISSHNTALDMLDEAIRWLLHDGLIQVTQFDTYAPTAVGAATVASGLNPEDGLFVHSDLRRALSSFVMDSEMHLLYLFTPIPQRMPPLMLTNDISWTVFRTTLDQLDEPSLKALILIGVNPALVNRLANEGVENLPENTEKEISTARMYRRVYSTFALRDICNEVSINTISIKYNIVRGTVQNLAQTCHGFAAGMIKFCQRMATPVQLQASESITGTMTMNGVHGPTSVQDTQASGFSMLAAVLEHMQSRLYASARADLLEMAQVTFVKGRMARLLYENGFKSIRSLSEADAKKDILPIMLSISGWKLKQMEREIVQHQHEPENAEKVNELYAVRRNKLEEKLLRKAEIMVKSAAMIYEREVLMTANFEE